MEQSIHHLPPPTPESRVESLQTIDMLRDAREVAAQNRAELAMKNSVLSLDMSNPPDSGILAVSDTARVGYDFVQLSYDDLLSYESLGVAPETVIEKTGYDSGPNDEVVFTSTVGDETLTAKRYAQGLSLTFDVAGHEPDFSDVRKPVAIRQVVTDRYMRSPGHRAVAEAAQSLHTSNEIPETVETGAFDTSSDRLGTAALLSRAGFMQYEIDEKVLASSESFADILENSDLPYNVDRVETDQGIEYVTTHRGVTTKLVFDETGTQASLQFRYDKNYYYAERANKSSAESIPFVDTICAEELCTTLDDVGILLSPQYQEKMTSLESADQYGAIYTQMSREIAKWVNRPSRQHVQELFVMFEPGYHANTDLNDIGYSRGVINRRSHEDEMSNEQAEAEESEIIKRLQSIDTKSLSEPARVLIEMVQDCLGDRTGSNNLPELPVTQSEIKIKNGACFDVTQNYISAASESRGLGQIEDSGVRLLKKTNSTVTTYMLQEPTALNGVRLPKGTLMQKGDDGGWAMLRLTPFCFDDPIDRLAMGSEIAKIDNGITKTTATRVGETALNTLIEAAR